ncbi:ABC transporter substrate-binding protein [Mycoplasma nasistruthionis]|uniref:Peptide ABC transporter substrate-binding protein n=1 Tax=Mycoplasma nasistruthionis TaxID=353852 RepID=A0A5B7XXN4_9MOLU|nr:ABC transporter substrate-binding protein [Mycoplasma nasistruthionis]QCZ36683.1 peptide ABC transporter substrate-binding protein [Mycoplasma nasistruthionis]
MNKKFKRLFTIGLVASAPLSIASLVACGQTKTDTTSNALINNSVKTRGYDLGLATEPINNLNYIKYKSMDKILPSIVDSFLKNGPSQNLSAIIKTNSYNFGIVDTKSAKGTSNFDTFFRIAQSNLKEEEGKGLITSQYYSIDQFRTVGGLADDSGSGANTRQKSTIYAFTNPRNSNNYMAFTGFTNVKKNQWSNGDYINAQDIRDYLEYIFDLNTGSQKLDQFRKFGFRAADKFIDAQKEYLIKHNQTYKNPFGRRRYVFSELLGRYIQDPADDTVWKSQIPGDEEQVAKIKQAALEFGFYTGQLFLDYDNSFIQEFMNLPENSGNFNLEDEVQEFTILDKTGQKVKIQLVKNPYRNPYQSFLISGNELSYSIASVARDENSFTAIFDENHTPDLSFLVFTIMYNLYPANRRYIETEGGGIDKYGSEPDKFLTSGPFYIPKGSNGILLGPNGYINLVKNNDYFDAENVISDKIRILFSTNRSTNALFFEDGYISQTYIPAAKMNTYWADPEFKEYLNKNTGYGTIAFGFNLDNEKNANSFIQDSDLRNAIYYGINRDSILKFVGWDFSFPVNTWTAYGQYKTFDGKNLETFFEGQKQRAKNDKEFALQNYDFVLHLAKSFNFEKTERRDLTYDVETAQFYLNRFKAKYPNQEKVVLRFLNNGSDEQKAAGRYLKETLERLSNGFVTVELKSLPENIFVSNLEKGEGYDIIYQNYDRLGGNGAYDYVSVFFKRDEIDTVNQKTIGFKDNPVGSFTYSDYLADLVIEKLQASDQNATKASFIQTDIDKIMAEINKQTSKITDLKQLTNYSKLKSDYQKLLQNITNANVLEFNRNHANFLATVLNQANPGKNYTDTYVSDLIDYNLLTNENIRKSRLNRAYVHYLAQNYTVQEIAELTQDTAERLMFNLDETLKETLNKQQIPNLWEKFIELSLPKGNETTFEYTSRISSFFSGNFSDQDLAHGWEQSIVYIFIGSLEKIIRDGAFVVPLMEVDTNWEITKVGGVDGLFRFALQYAYDFTRPPRENLPKKREG